jgi:hypothetical protein
MFDYESVAREAGVSENELKRLMSAVRREFPRDDMMFELGVLRACMAVRDGRVTVAEALAPESETGAP